MRARHELEARQALAMAQAALQGDQPETALGHVRLALRTDPSTRAAWLLEARIHLRRNDPEAALQSLDHFDANAPDARDLPEVAMLRAEALVRSGRDDLGNALLQRLSSEFPDDARPYELLAGVALRAGRPGGAIAALRELVRLRPHSLPDRCALARLLEERSPRGAVAVLEALPGAQPDASLRLWRAGLHQRDGRWRLADEAYAAVLGDPHAGSDAQTWHQAGVLGDTMGADALGVRRLSRAMQMSNRQHEPSLHALGLAHLHAGRFGAAARCFWRLARHREDKPAYWAGLAVCALAADRPRLAARVRHILGVHTSKSERQHHLAEYWQHAACGRVVARAAANTGAAPPPTGVPSPLQDLLRRAVHTLQVQAQHTPARADYHFHRAQCHLALGHSAAAGAAAREALAINPQYAAASGLAARLDHAEKQVA